MVEESVVQQLCLPLDDVIRNGLHLPAPTVALGTFDGVHLGHQAIIRRAKELAAQVGGVPIAFTFDRHPAEVVEGRPVPPLLTDLRDRLALLAEQGVAATVVARFDRTFSRISAASFVQDVLVKALGARVVVCGFNFRFGQAAAGDVQFLEACGRTMGFDVAVLPAVEVNGVTVSSTEIRRRLLAGQPEAAAALLGRPFRLKGTVIAGEGRGRQLGFPTANLRLPGGLLVPAEGVYRAWARWETGSTECRHPALAVISRKPTFAARQEPGLEVHVLDFQGDLYGREMAVEFLAFQRGITRFESAEALRRQVENDVALARARFGL